MNLFMSVCRFACSFVCVHVCVYRVRERRVTDLRDLIYYYRGMQSRNIRIVVLVLRDGDVACVYVCTDLL